MEREWLKLAISTFLFLGRTISSTIYLNTTLFILSVDPRQLVVYAPSSLALFWISHCGMARNSDISGFGSNTNTSNSLFGGQNRPFGSTSTTTGGGFGSNTQTSAFGSSGFGTGTSGFGSTSNTGTGGGIFGSKPSGGFGSTGNQTGSIFGGTSTSSPATNTGTGFGATTAASGFGGSGTALAGEVPPSQGTANPTFSPFTEKDPGSSNTSNYQSISFMTPYQKYSFEELRVADYEQGRRYGNASGQPGAFGSFSGFGQGSSGFGTTAASSSPFGGSTTATSGFGTQNQTQNTGFGSNTSNPLFGATKPATGIFGQTGSTPSTGFGTTGTTGGFGTSTTNTFGGANTGGGLFGNTQQKTTGFGTTATPTLGTGFGTQTNTTNSSPFGNTQTSTTFGQQGSSGFGTFGQNQNQAKPAFGGFGQTQPQQQQTGGGLFGSTPATSGTGSSLFGNNNQQQGSSIFGQQNQQTNTSGGLFGNTQQNQQQQKPGGLFGTGLGTNTSTTGTSGFGLGTSQPAQQTSSLFGNTQQKSGSLFGTTPTQGSSLFGNNSAPASSSIFGVGNSTQNTQQQQTGGLGTGGNSLFGQSQQQPQQQQPSPSGFQASLLDGNPYGSQSIFSGLPAPNTPSPGPLATPLSASMKQKQRTPLPMYKISPLAANRLVTPPTRQGYGFSYSTSSTASTPGSSSIFGGSLRSGGSLGRSFGKSLTGSSSLRKTWDPETDSILSPGAFSAGNSRQSGSLKRLTIDRNLRTDLFSRSALTNGDEAAPPSSKLKKKVSFDDAVSPGDSADKANGAIVRVESDTSEPTPEELGFLRSARKQSSANSTPTAPKSVELPNGAPSASSTPQMEQVRGKELATVPENGEQPALTTPTNKPLVIVPNVDPKPGEYWMKPSRAELSKMSREELKQVPNFTVGRVRCGSVTFDRPVDLTTVNLDDIFDKIAKITIRSITVYPDEATKPPRGKGLNMPSTLRIENSWPRGRDKRSPSPFTSGPTFEKHIKRLKEVTNTEFIDYEKETGTWVFTVPHFTTYGLDYDDDDEDEGESFNQSTLSAAPDSVASNDQTPTQSSGIRNFDTSMSIESSLFDDSVSGLEDDTFEFKKKKPVPGAYARQGVNGMGALPEDMESENEADQDSFLEDGSAGSVTNESEEQLESMSPSASELESDRDEDMEMAGSFPVPDQTVELTLTGPLKKNNLFQSMPRFGTPTKSADLNLQGNWAEQLQRTISPRKQDRQALREVQDRAFLDRDEDESPTATSKATEERPTQFTTSIDLMNSLFRQPKRQGTSPAPAQSLKAKSGLEWPYPKKPKTFAGKSSEMAEIEASFHHSTKARWGVLDEVVLPNNRPEVPVYGEKRLVNVSKFDHETAEAQNPLQLQKTKSIVRLVDNVPFASLALPNFGALAEAVIDTTKAADTERWLWQLANILFNDDLEDDISEGVPAGLLDNYKHRIKKDRLSRLWETMIRTHHPNETGDLKTAEERAFSYLCAHRVEEACKLLIDSGNPHLASLVSQIGRDEDTRKAMQDQIESWRKAGISCEISEPIRAIYELLAGNCLRSEGKPSGPPEERISTFNMSDRFELDWFQAFGLRLWYGISDDDPIEDAVTLFHHDVYHEGEPQHPLAVATKDSNQKPGDDPVGRESPFWILLKTYTLAVNDGTHPEIAPIQMPAAITPVAVSGHMLHNRLSFQLFHHLSKVVGHHDVFAVDQSRADQLALDLSWELTTAEQYAPALFVLLHLSRPSDRERSVKEILSRFASLIPSPTAENGTPSSLWTYLTVELQVPPDWLWISKALHSRAIGDIASEVECLIHAKHWNEAHGTFYRIVAPKAVIERDYDTLASLLSGFGESPERRVRDWADGGAVYQDFLQLVNAKGGWRDPAPLKRLLKALAHLGGKVEKSATSSLYERIAFREMSRLVAGWATKDVGNVSLAVPRMNYHINKQNLTYQPEYRVLHNS
ncbi:uncharacterized protein ARB_02296 [Trichophyton benhamiae CBS 112371]|uniref:Peptidase S59 domain-containing protein n=1 Tax=Arthroderma benhamiae (strain ATCC MYA-4681 / CBS 112371) TaxID=663331 RepID=D4B1G7_ARTBC|nr:uncharacterized protein ARB_02296 [Trichophyton benhamiae CBS 112371]EFE30806.1 hypothetical protein ARB_02296 [Trichophyton benhamiae CBS 112371]